MGPEVLKQVLIPVVAILAGLAAVFMPVLIVWMGLQYRARQTERVFQAVQSLSERGLPIPPGLVERGLPGGSGGFWQPRDRRRTGSPLFWAMTLLGLGAGVAVMFWLMGLVFLTGIGAVFICIGLAQIVALLLERRWPPPESASGF